MTANVNRNANPRCGELWMCQLPAADGSVQGGYRPVFVLSNDVNNAHSPTLNVIPLTSRVDKRPLPVHVPLWNYRLYGLRKPSVMLVEQIATVPIHRLVSRIGSIDDAEMLRSIRSALAIQFPIIAQTGF